MPLGITTGPDEALWFVEAAGNKIGRVTTGGTFTEFAVPTPLPPPVAIALGLDCALGFTENAGNKTGHVTNRRSDHRDFGGDNGKRSDRDHRRA
jgi:virginiamycin B lyase